MKCKKTVVTILLNVLFCGVMLWLFARNSYLRPFSGSYFKEIFRFSKECRFSNCTHTHEPGCAVLKALEDHYIAQSRYQSYLSMLDDKEEGKYRAAY